MSIFKNLSVATAGAVFIALGAVTPTNAVVLTFGDKDLLGTGTYASEPTAGATLEGLSPDTITPATSSFGHSYPFSPNSTDFIGTEQIFIGSTQTASLDGYSEVSSRLDGPQNLLLNYNSLVPVGQQIGTLTLGIAADDFHQPGLNQPFSATVNGVLNTALTTQLNNLDQSGPRVQFFTIGIEPSILQPSNTLTLSIDGGGNGGDGWATDFLTVGITTTPVSTVPLPDGVSIPFEFSPGLGILLLGAWGAIAQLNSQVQKHKSSARVFSKN